MSAETILHAALAALTPVTASVGKKIRPGALHESDKYPGIVYRRESTEYTNTIGNVAAASKVTIDVICLDDTFDGAEALCDAVEQIGVEKLDRRSAYDPDTRAFAAVITVAIWP